MVTGDSGRTAEAIAHRIGLTDGDAQVIAGAALAALDNGELGRPLAPRQVIFARIDPEQKLRLAQLLRARGKGVAMTGDGVNDAPALKHADISVAMGLVDKARQRIAALGEVEPHAAYGQPAEESAAYSASLDLLIVGSRGYSPIGRVIHGSISQQLARTARCPLLVLTRGARTTEAPEAGQEEQEAAVPVKG